jgi:hypothetical protein
MAYKGSVAEEMKDLYGVDVANKHLRDNELKRMNPLVLIPGSTQPYQGIPTMSIIPFWRNPLALLGSNLLRAVVARPDSVCVATVNFLMSVGLGAWAYMNGPWAMSTYVSLQTYTSSADFVLEVLNPTLGKFSGSPLNIYPTYLEHVRAKVNKLN